jgi:signal transduction histidine kinase/ActR/RegA family two-component response regulator
MRPMKLRSQLVLLTLGNLFLLLAFAGAAGWVAAQGGFALSSETAWLMALCLLGAIALQLLPALALAKRIARATAPLDSIAKALMTGAKAEMPPKIRVAELAGACDKLVHAVNAVQARDAALRAADRTKDEFFAMLGHELRNPLAALAAAAHVLRNAPSGEATVRATDVVARQVQHMSRLIEDLLDLSRVTRGKVSLSRQPLNLALTVEKTVHELRVAGRLDRHDVRLELSEVWTRADEARIQQIVSNLVGNAVKYTPEGGSIVVTLRRDRDVAVLRVRDNGIGMSPELAARVFDLFVQGEEPGRRGAAGLGIGLALVKHLAELHGGKAFAASSGSEQGSTFTVSLPAIEAHAEEAAAAVAGTPESRHRILLVEDNADTRETMVAALKLDGHRVYEAVDGNTGMRTIAEVKPDVAVIDIGLPDLDGYEVASALRRDPECQNMVLVAITGFEQPDSLRRAREAGFDEYVTKPIPPDRLVRLIDAAFAAKARRPSG